jgi:hypothetical protein
MFTAATFASGGATGIAGKINPLPDDCTVGRTTGIGCSAAPVVRGMAVAAASTELPSALLTTTLRPRLLGTGVKCSW